MERKASYIIFLLFVFFLLPGCTYNPFSNNNNLTGSATGTAVGAAIGAGGAAAFDSSAPIVYLAGATGAALGYYATTLRFDAAGIVSAKGQVFVLGDYVTIEIPTDNLFDTNSDELLPNTEPILCSVNKVLKRYPKNNIVISGNTSGFYTERYEVRLSEARARQVAAYLWVHGINQFKGESLQLRKLLYVGYGNYFPIANNIRAKSIRQNSRIQITSFPRYARMDLKNCHVFNNIGALNEPPLMCHEGQGCDLSGEFQGDTIPEGPPGEQVPPIPIDSSYTPERPSLKGENESIDNYKSIESSPNTNEGVRVPKHGGFKGESGLKGEG